MSENTTNTMGWTTDVDQSELDAVRELREKLLREEREKMQARQDAIKEVIAEQVQDIVRKIRRDIYSTIEEAVEDAVGSIASQSADTASEEIQQKIYEAFDEDIDYGTLLQSIDAVQSGSTDTLRYQSMNVVIGGHTYDDPNITPSMLVDLILFTLDQNVGFDIMVERMKKLHATARRIRYQ